MDSLLPAHSAPYPLLTEYNPCLIYKFGGHPFPIIPGRFAFLHLRVKEKILIKKIETPSSRSMGSVFSILASIIEP